jgi:hypothetical protein
MNPISEDEFADYKDNYFGFDAGNGIKSQDTDWQFAQDFMSDEEIQEILEVESELDIDLSDLEDELLEESEEALMDSADADSDWAE